MYDQKYKKLSDELAQFAYQALLYEPVIWPRFGLVGPDDKGAHHDMDYALLCKSSVSFVKFFRDTALLGFTIDFREEELFLCWLDLYYKAIADMLLVTNGINTHKGAAFLLGLLLLSWTSLNKNLAFLDIELDVNILLNKAKKLSAKVMAYNKAKNLVLRYSETYGEWCIRRYNWRGIRGIIEDEFFLIKNAFYKYQHLKGYNIKIRLGYLRHYFLAFAEDSNLVKRGSFDKTIQLLAYSKKLFLQGSVFNNYFEILKLEDYMKTNRLSAAAAGDLLTILIFLIQLYEKQSLFA